MGRTIARLLRHSLLPLPARVAAGSRVGSPSAWTPLEEFTARIAGIHLKLPGHCLSELQPHRSKQVRRHKDEPLVMIRRPGQAGDRWVLRDSLVDLHLQGAFRRKYNVLPA